MMSENELRQRVEAMTKNFAEKFLDVSYHCANLSVTTEAFVRLCLDELGEQILQLAHELDEE